MVRHWQTDASGTEGFGLKGNSNVKSTQHVWMMIIGWSRQGVGGSFSRLVMVALRVRRIAMGGKVRGSDLKEVREHDAITIGKPLL